MVFEGKDENPHLLRSRGPGLAAIGLDRPGSWAWTQRHHKKTPFKSPTSINLNLFWGMDRCTFNRAHQEWSCQFKTDSLNWNALHLDWITSHHVTLLGGPSQEIHVHRRVRVLILIQPALWTLFDDTITISECGPIHLNRRGEMVKGMVCNRINNINNHDSSCYYLWPCQTKPWLVTKNKVFKSSIATSC